MIKRLVVLIASLIILGVIEIISGFAWLVWHNKITLFLLGVGTVLLVIAIIFWFINRYQLKKEIKKRLKNFARKNH